MECLVLVHSALIWGVDPSFSGTLQLPLRLRKRRKEIPWLSPNQSPFFPKVSSGSARSIRGQILHSSSPNPKFHLPQSRDYPASSPLYPNGHCHTVWGPFQWPLGVGGERSFAESLRRKRLEQDSICCDAEGGGSPNRVRRCIGVPYNAPQSSFIPAFSIVHSHLGRGAAGLRAERRDP